MANGKSKGNSYERDIANRMSLFLTDGKEKYAIWRSTSSGAHSTILSKKQSSVYSKKHAGDLIQTVDKGLFPKLDLFFDKYFVETKAYKQVDLFPPLKSDLTVFFDQLLREKEESGKQIFFVLKRNNKKELLMSDLPIEGLNKQILIWYKEYEFFVYLFQEFLDQKI